MGIKLHTLTLILALGGQTLPVSAWAADAAAPPVINFADLKGVRSWQTGGEAIVFVKSTADQWYKAELAETCMALDTKKGINFITEIDPDTNEKVSKVVVDRHICRVISLTKVAAPPAAKP